MRRLALAIVTSLVVMLPGSVAGADPSAIVQVTFPDAADEMLDFWQVPWSSGATLNGAIEVETACEISDLTIHTVDGAKSSDAASRRVIPGEKISFTPEQVLTGSGSPKVKDPNQPLPPGRYLFNFVVDGIPGADTYVAELEAAGQYKADPTNLRCSPQGKSAAQGDMVPFTVRLPAMKLKAFADATVRPISGKTLSVQWTNLAAPIAFLRPFERFLNHRIDDFWYRTNPPPAAAVTMPGRPTVPPYQKSRVTVDIDPVLDKNQNQTSQVKVRIVKAGEEGPPLSPDQISTTYDATWQGENLVVQVYRDFTVANGTVQAERIRPGTYSTTLHIRTAYGSAFEQPVEISVRDAPLWPTFALVAGIFISLLTAYWQSRQPLYQARIRGRRCRRLYDEQGLIVPVVNRLMMQLDAMEQISNATEATRTVIFLEELLHDQPRALALDAAVDKLKPMDEVSEDQLWAIITTADGITTAFNRLKEYCRKNKNDAVKAMEHDLESYPWYPAPLKSGPKPGLSSPIVRNLVAALKRFIRQATEPAFWDVAVLVLMFILVNGSLIVLQISESYGHNAEFGSVTDYLNLLFWGFAGDLTRTKVTTFAAQVLPGARTNPPPADGSTKSTDA